MKTIHSHIFSFFHSFIFRHVACCAVLIAAMCSCSDNFHVEGTITEAKDSTLYFEHMSLDGVVVMDSIVLDEDGDFDFSFKGNETPEFYRLRIARNIINVSIDSTETVTFKASYPTMASKYEVEGSDNCKRIKELSILQQQLLAKIIAVNNTTGISYKETEDSINNMIEQYKDYVRTNYIIKDPRAASSYFALFQTIGNRLIFQPQESEMDIRTFAAVATAWDTYYGGEAGANGEVKHVDRAENLHNIAIEGLKALRIKQAREYGPAIDPDKVQVISVFDIPLNDNKGKRRSLTEFKGRVVLLDFHAFSMPESVQRIMMLRDIYNKYHDRGFEIYQVSVDDNEHYWKTKTSALPWVCVHDPAGVESEYLQKYNVTQIPTFFLIDKNNSLEKRDSQIKDLDSEIQSLL